MVVNIEKRENAIEQSRMRLRELLKRTDTCIRNDQPTPFFPTMDQSNESHAHNNNAYSSTVLPCNDVIKEEPICIPAISSPNVDLHRPVFFSIKEESIYTTSLPSPNFVPQQPLGEGTAQIEHGMHTSMKSAHQEGVPCKSRIIDLKSGQLTPNAEMLQKELPNHNKHNPPSSIMKEKNCYDEVPEMYDTYIHELHMLIPHDSFGCIVGPRGDFVRHINRASCCTLSVRDESVFPLKYDRVLRLYGNAQAICLAQKLVIERIRAYRQEKNDPNYTELGGSTLVRLPSSSVTPSMLDAVHNVNNHELDDAETVVKWIIHKDDVGKIMGKEGVLMKELARSTRTTIHVSSSKDIPIGGTERTVSINGNPTAVESARAEIERRAGGRLDDGDSFGKCGQYFAIPYHAGGALIGHQGSITQLISKQTGARVQIPSQEVLRLGCRNRSLHIQGNKEQIARALEILTERLREHMRSTTAQIAAEKDDIYIKIVIAHHIGQSLLENRGKVIQEITGKSGALARLLPATDDTHRICAIFGEISCVFHAERLLLEFIAADAISNHRVCPAPRKRKRVINANSEAESDPEFEQSPHRVTNPISCRVNKLVASTKRNGKGRVVYSTRAPRKDLFKRPRRR